MTPSPHSIGSVFAEECVIDVSSAVTLPEPFTIRLLNTKFPCLILRFRLSEVVSNPASVGANGGDVSVGGQQSDLSSGELVAVKLESAAIFLAVAVTCFNKTSAVEDYLH